MNEPRRPWWELSDAEKLQRALDRAVRIRNEQPESLGPDGDDDYDPLSLWSPFVQLADEVLRLRVLVEELERRVNGLSSEADRERDRANELVEQLRYASVKD